MPVDPRTPVVVGVGQFTERIDDAGLPRHVVGRTGHRGRAGRAGRHRGRRGRRGARRSRCSPGCGSSRSARRSPAAAGRVRQLPAVGGAAHRRRPGARGARAHRRQRPAEAGDRVRRCDRRRRHRGRADPRLRTGFDGDAISPTATTSRTSPSTSAASSRTVATASSSTSSEYTVKHGLTGAPVQYGLLDNARRARLGLGVDEYRRQMAELFAPFSKVAAKNPFSSSPVERSVDETRHRHRREPDDLRPVSAADGGARQVNQGAAALVMSVAPPADSGCPRRSGCTCTATPTRSSRSCWTASTSAPAASAELAVAEALRVAGIGIDDVATFDLYSCFPFPVFVVCDALGLATDDPRGLTLTGGLPYFGGPGNSYSLHGIAETVVPDA